jgi:hypothetical protein
MSQSHPQRSYTAEWPPSLCHVHISVGDSGNPEPLGCGSASCRHPVVTLNITSASLRDLAELPAFTSDDTPKGNAERRSRPLDH